MLRQMQFIEVCLFYLMLKTLHRDLHEEKLTRQAQMALLKHAL